MTEQELLALQDQLSCPTGNTGVSVGNNMYQSNFGMIENTIQVSNIKEEDSILEIGHGN